MSLDTRLIAEDCSCRRRLTSAARTARTITYISSASTSLYPGCVDGQPFSLLSKAWARENVDGTRRRCPVNCTTARTAFKFDHAYLRLHLIRTLHLNPSKKRFLSRRHTDLVLLCKHEVRRTTLVDMSSSRSSRDIRQSWYRLRSILPFNEACCGVRRSSAVHGTGHRGQAYARPRRRSQPRNTSGRIAQT